MKKRSKQQNQIINLLKHYREIENLIKIDQQYLDMQPCIKGVSYDKEKVQTSNINSLTENEAIARSKRRKRLEQNIQTKKTLELLEEEYYQVIKRYYINKDSWISISYKMHISESYCRKLRDEAISKLQLYLFAEVDIDSDHTQLALNF